MKLFKVSDLKRKRIFGLPTFRGLIVFILLAYASWNSIYQNSEVERWILLSMILVILVHLFDASVPFQMLELTFFTNEPPFKDELTEIFVQLANPSNFILDELVIKIDGTKDWVQLGNLLAHTSTQARLKYKFTESGRQELPKLIVRSYQRPKFFRFWRNFKTDVMIYVLPAPKDHNIAFMSSNSADIDDELKELEQIFDPRLLSYRDEKMFLKTGLAYRRVHQSQRPIELIELNWNKLEVLDPQSQQQQFSFWLNSVSKAQLAGDQPFSIKAPFIGIEGLRTPVDWKQIKILFAEWLYGPK